MKLVANSHSASLVPATIAEQAAAAQSWQRRGLLGRLVRQDETTPATQVPDLDRRDRAA